MKNYSPYILSFEKLLNTASFYVAKGGDGSITVELLKDGIWEKYDSTGFDKRKRFDALKEMIERYIQDYPDQFEIINDVSINDDDAKIYAKMKRYRIGMNRDDLRVYANQTFKQ